MEATDLYLNILAEFELLNRPYTPANACTGWVRRNWIHRTLRNLAVIDYCACGSGEGEDGGGSRFACCGG